MFSFRSTNLRASGVLALLGVALFVAGCGSSSSSSSSSTAAASTSSYKSAPASTASSPTSTPVAISTTSGSSGSYLTASGRALYLWVADTGSQSSCSGACAKVWPPLIAKSSPVASGSAMAADVGTITRSDGSKQVTYKGHPLYYFAGDSGAGMTHGQGSNSFGAKWWLVTPSGAPITTGGSAGSASSSGTSTGSSGGSAGGGWS